MNYESAVVNNREADLATRVREAVGVVKEADLSTLALDERLHLDSIQRISLLVELENLVGVELAGDDIEPEMFDTLQKLIDSLEGLTR